ncbi:enoyl-CoA hydratase/isomerase family protein [Flavobacterium sp. MAH-1]|uniref:Enoyl-CoA hydratase/isomerase family protein n=1 Tax=Flavobacterium agri TaxID=2743471 RepID=A0A7Y8Y2M2_9FLAO|nr:enoyl-CoA hydratase/isomerase family protein [Flavobacterium agri]NUY81450.1 enoyl-CoA hydratase/isomerase family protein [Flavobacterium agri]NYA71474.1 enoyl-CoA hydratase/isomerase family protein [Flavobacterium agri]
MTVPGTLRIEKTDRIATVTFGHPSGNSFPSAALQKLTEAFEALGKDNDISIIVLKSEGDGPFCAGASFDELLAVSNLEEGTRFFSGFANVINAMRRCPKLIIGRVQGKTVGGGVGLAAACDHVLATEQALIKLSELAIGIGPFVIAPAVERKMGLAALSELTLCATDWKSAYWAKEKGLYENVYKNTDSLDEALDGFTKTLASYNPEALTQMKKTLWHDTDHWGTLLYERAAISGNLVLSDFTKNALNQFKKK